MALPDIEEVEVLVGGRKAVAALQGPPMRLGGSHIVEYLDPRNLAVERRHRPFIRPAFGRQ